ncbi:FYVE zinc finger-domain-containing protein [Abortiporus biennis]|nr:FYVE zinc finger-domain-containing protein [Abortiporus biennis]
MSSLITRITSLAPAIHTINSADSGDESASIISSQGTCSSLSSSHSGISDSDNCNVLRRNEHLAVLLPTHLWKPDSQASRCNTFLCRKRFTLVVRKHHCRKCGDIFCGDCSSRTTHLLDTSKLEFFHPPRDTPIYKYHSSKSPVLTSRVCDDCWDQIHGNTRSASSRSPVLNDERSVITAALALTQDSMSDSTSSASSTSSSPVCRPSMRRANTSPKIASSPLRTASPSSPSSTYKALHDDSNHFGELEHYPLRHASAICKANGGGRWEPKPVNLVGYRIPGSKLPHEIELEREEEEIRRRRANPIIKNGDFQLRVPKEIEPRSLGGPFQFSTF